MTNAQEQYRTRSMYDNPRSKEARAKEEGRGAKPSPVAQVRARHREEKKELVERHRHERAKLEHGFDVENSDRIMHGMKPVPDSHETSAETRRKKIVARHKEESGALSARHDRELEAALKQHPLA